MIERITSEFFTAKAKASSWGKSAAGYRMAARRYLCWPMMAWLVVLLTVQTAQAQEDSASTLDPTGQDIPLIDQQPFDLIHLKSEAGGGTFGVFPLPFAERRVPSSPDPSDRLQVVLKKFPERLYQIAWKWIDRIDLYEDLVLQEAQRQMSDKNLIGAFQNLSFLMKNYPSMPRLLELRREFLFNSLTISFSSKQYAQTLSTLEELKETAPGFRQEAVGRALNTVATSMLTELERVGDLESARQLLARLQKKHGDIDSVKRWNERLSQLASAKQVEASEAFAAGRFRQAYQAISDSLSILPTFTGGRELQRELHQRYPLVRVGVMQPSRQLDVSSLTDWSARRSGRLVQRALFQFQQIGNEGGVYSFGLGKFRISDDQRQLILQFDPRTSSSRTRLELFQTLIARANPEDEQYDANWASVCETVALGNESQLVIQLRRPHVLPHSLLQWPLSEDTELGAQLAGLFQVPINQEQSAYFVGRSLEQSAGRPVEIIEIHYSNAQQAINDLIRGQIDVLDQVFPADARRLAALRNVKVIPYALPTSHMLIPISNHAYLASEKFRRALLYATNRQEILHSELLGSTNPAEGRLLSGPFAVGQRDTEPLAYAYNEQVPAVAYNPLLAKLLVSITRQELEKRALKAGQPQPNLETLVVGCPDYELARVAVEAMIQQWAIVGVPAEMRVLSEGVSQQSIVDCDLLYVMAAMWEPVVDIQRLLAGDGLTASNHPLLVQSLERVRDARNWREVRTSLQELHQVIAYHLPLLPLWQITDRLVVRSSVQGISDRPVSLYQDVDRWRLQPDTLAAQ
ncbi:MAG: hypothetical protein KF752_18825 [Pirellulaceae bacterium]|nr:hypothetical protein [Pirellulaceae bacterium]